MHFDRSTTFMLSIALFVVSLFVWQTHAMAGKKSLPGLSKSALQRPVLKLKSQLKPRKIVGRHVLSKSFRKLNIKQKRGLLALGNVEMAWKLYQHLAKKNQKNLVFSPYSLSISLSMTYAGARKQTAKEIRKVLSFRLPDSDIHDTYANIMYALQPPKILKRPPPKRRPKFISHPVVQPKFPKPLFQLTIANKLWGNVQTKFLPPFLKVLAKQYDSKLVQLNFKKFKQARKRINAWIANKTHQKIKNLLKPGSVNANTQLILTNAVYFKSAWGSQFYKSLTKMQPFWISQKKSKKVATMRQSSWYKHYGTKQADILHMPYKGKALSMILIIPKKREGLQMLRKTLNATTLSLWMSRGLRRYVNLYLPKFKFQTKLGLKSTLQAMGMKRAFGSGADFSGMTKKTKLKLGDAIHQAYIDVHEKGTEAAAATAVIATLVMLPATPKPLVIRADRPFLFVIRHNQTGQLLFLGQVTKNE